MAELVRLYGNSMRDSPSRRIFLPHYMASIVMAGLVRLCENYSPLRSGEDNSTQTGNGHCVSVMAGLVPAIHDFNRLKFHKAWMAGTRPAMTEAERAGYTKKLNLHPSPKSELSHSLLMPVMTESEQFGWLGFTDRSPSAIALP